MMPTVVADERYNAISDKKKQTAALIIQRNYRRMMVLDGLFNDFIWCNGRCKGRKPASWSEMSDDASPIYKRICSYTTEYAHYFINQNS